MKLSAPIFVLKAQAKELKNTEKISLNEALDIIAQKEGFSSWSLLAAKAKDILPKNKKELLDFLNPGDLALLASRPQMGKTSFALGILVEAMRTQRSGYFFSLESDRKQTASKLAVIDEKLGENQRLLKFDFSNDISADYVCNSLSEVELADSVIVIDYLQLLDQKRTNPALQEQVEKLKKFAADKKCIFILISQVDRFAESWAENPASLKDIRLPNPLDLSLINKIIFLDQGRMIFLKPKI